MELIGVVGAGTMGAGIAQVALEYGHEVVLHDVDEVAVQRGRARIRDGLGRRAARLGLDADTIDDWVDARLAGLRQSESLDEVGAEADVVIEAALEDLELKREIFRALDDATGSDVVLATNTSALSVGRIADAVNRSERVIGLHFFNPAPVMALVEVVASRVTSAKTVGRSVDLVERWGKRAVRSGDSPGFIVNRVNRPFTLEALAIQEANPGSVEQIDDALRADGFPMGPFELMDLIGVDVNLAVATAIWEGFDRAERFRPSVLQQRLVDEGRLGRKSGNGFYEYDAEGARLPSHDEGTAARQTSPAEIVERVRVAIAAEAYRARDVDVASPADIDLALKLGAGHPQGPFEWVEAHGGPTGFLERLRRLEHFGARFEVPDGLLQEAGLTTR